MLVGGEGRGRPLAPLCDGQEDYRHHHEQHEETTGTTSRYRRALIFVEAYRNWRAHLFFIFWDILWLEELRRRDITEAHALSSWAEPLGNVHTDILPPLRSLGDQL